LFRSGFWMARVKRGAFAARDWVVVLWACHRPLSSFLRHWAMVMRHWNGSIATFLMVFLIQNTQNRDARAIHLEAQ